MLAERPPATLSRDDADQFGDRSMTVLQYTTAALAVFAAVLLTFVR